MKKANFLSGFFVLCAILTTVSFSSCEKDEVTLKADLEGTWNVSSWTTNGTQTIVPRTSRSYTFVGDCSGSYSVEAFGTSFTSTLTYSISEDKTVLSIDYLEPEISDIMDVTITQYSATRFEFNGNNVDGDLIVVTMAKS
ncbi:MAG: lipocalin family protein [Lewinella sp.]